MIKDLITLLKLSNYYGKSEVIEQAKGRYCLDSSFKGIVRSIKRTLHYPMKNKVS